MKKKSVKARTVRRQQYAYYISVEISVLNYNIHFIRCLDKEQ